ncbi:MAG: hypothetical protein DMG49_12060 [Acidobacteria bacterium]|nr:MAG: hypothetical protein DMG49_12060 [Acidobacteriota bacterium]
MVGCSGMREVAVEECSFVLGRQSAREEAHALYRMVGRDRNTVEALRELIAVPPLPAALAQ